MRKNQLWTITAAALLTVSLFVMGCSTDASTSGPNPITVEVTATTDNVAAGGTVGFTAVLYENGVPVTSGLTYTWSDNGTESGTAFADATLKNVVLNIDNAETGVITATVSVTYDGSSYDGSKSVSIIDAEEAVTAINAIGTAAGGSDEAVLFAALQDANAGLDQKYVLADYKPYYLSNKAAIASAATLVADPTPTQIAAAVGALNAKMKELTQAALLAAFNGAADAPATALLLTQENFAALEDDGEGWATYYALSADLKPTVAAYLYANKTYGNVGTLQTALETAIVNALAYKGDLIVTGGTTEANTFYYSVAAEDVTGFTDYISYINTVTSRAAIEFAIDGGSGTVLTDFTTGTDLTGEDRGNKIIVVEYTASTDGTVVAYSATPGTIPESGNANVEVALTPASDPSAILLAPGSYGTAGTTSITGLTSGKYVVLSDGVWHKTVSSGASTLTSTADLVTAMGASVADTTSITGLTSGTTYNVYKVEGLPLSAADIKNTIVDASGITTVESVLTAGATATGATVLVYLDAEITPAITATTLTVDTIPQSSTSIWVPSALGTAGTTKIAAANNAKYFTLSTIGAEATLSLTKLTKLSGQITGVTKPAKYETPASSATGPANTTGTPAITWTKTSGGAAGTAFDVGTAYTATFTLTADAGYTFKGLAADAFTVEDGTATVSVTATGAATVTFAATAGFALADLPASSKYTGTTLASASSEVSLNSGILTFNSSGVKAATISTASGSDGEKINNLLAKLKAADLFTISGDAIDTITLKAVPTSSVAATIGDLLGIADLTIDYTDAELGGVTVPTNKTLTVNSVQATPAVVSSSTLTVTASGAALAGTGYIKTNGGTITYGSLSGLTVTTAAVANDVVTGIGVLADDIDAIAATNDTNAIDVTTTGDNFTATDLDTGPTSGTALTATTTLAGGSSPGLTVNAGLPTGLTSVTLSKALNGTTFQLAAVGTSTTDGTGVTVTFKGKLTASGVTTGDIDIKVKVTTTAQS